MCFSIGKQIHLNQTIIGFSVFNKGKTNHMENSNQTSATHQIPKHPKPSDDVQLEIETVTPDTEKEVKPTAQEQLDHQAEVATEQPQPPNDTVSENDDKEKGTASESAEDERDQIETVSP